MSPPLSTYAERVWYAYQCLPRAKGKGRRHGLPTYRSLENDPKRNPDPTKPALATWSKLFSGERTDPRTETKKLIADTLGVDRAWLELGIGTPPQLTAPYRPMPLDETLAEHDPSEWARKYDAIGGPSGPPNNFQVAVLFLGSALTTKTVEAGAARAQGREHEMTPLGWARVLTEIQGRPTKRKKTGTSIARDLPAAGIGELFDELKARLDAQDRDARKVG